MQQSDILSLAERLIPAYHSGDFEKLLNQITADEPPSVKILLKMELNRIMAPCQKVIDLRGRVQGECREYELDGLTHWLDDVAFNAYHKNTRKFGGYTEGVWEALSNTRNNFRVMQQRGKPLGREVTAKENQYDVEPLTLGYDLKRKENRLKVSSQVEMTLRGSQLVHGLTLDLSPSGAKIKVPSAFEYKLGDTLTLLFSELAKTSEVIGLQSPMTYRILAVDESYDNDAVKYLRLLKLDNDDTIDQLIDESLRNDTQRTKHDNQDKVIRARTRSFEHAYLKHTCALPLFFSGSELKLALMTENNQPIWQYWHDERNQQSLTSLLNPQRLSLLTSPGVRATNNVLYTFTHEHQDKTLFFSMMMPEATREQRQLFWHIGAKKPSWKVFRLHIFELNKEECRELIDHAEELAVGTNTLTHCGILQEIADDTASHDYLLSEKPKLASSELNAFRHPRNQAYEPRCLYFDAVSRRKEPRYPLQTPVELTANQQTIAGKSFDFSKRGLNLKLETPCALKSGDECLINFLELQLYDKNLPLNTVPYRVIRVSPNGKQLQMVMLEDSKTIKTIAFFNTLIEHNQAKLKPKTEILPSDALLEGLHDILLDKMVSTPIFVDKPGANLRPKVMGVNYPLLPHLALFAQLGNSEQFSLAPIYKGHTNTLLAQPMKRIDGAIPQYHELYICAFKFGKRIQSVEAKLREEFTHIKERIAFIKNAQSVGECFVLRICGAPVFDPMTTLLRKDLEELATISMPQAKKLEKEIASIIGYSEITDITEEVLVRLQLTR
ncbi:PilZ domain-containing protein [Vibrio sp. AK197]